VDLKIDMRRNKAKEKEGLIILAAVIALLLFTAVVFHITEVKMLEMVFWETEE